MQALRDARLAARLVLAWFVLAVGLAAASPLLKPPGTDFICSANGSAVVPGPDAGGGAEPMLDCPLCLPLDVPVAQAPHLGSGPAPAASPALAEPDAPRAPAAALPPPARAPPVSA